MNKTKSIISWVLRVLISLGFILASSGKLTNNPQVLEMFKNWGFPDGFHFVIGILELVLAILLLVPKTLKIALVGISVIMLGAIVTHLLHDPISNVLRPIVFLVLLVGVYFLTRQVKT